jgi:hypothetical protein
MPNVLQSVFFFGWICPYITILGTNRDYIFRVIGATCYYLEYITNIQSYMCILNIDFQHLETDMTIWLAWLCKDLIICMESHKCCQLRITENSGLSNSTMYGAKAAIWQYFVVNSISQNKSDLFKFHYDIAAI